MNFFEELSQFDSEVSAACGRELCKALAVFPAEICTGCENTDAVYPQR